MTIAHDTEFGVMRYFIVFLLFRNDRSEKLTFIFRNDMIDKCR